jgi:hypothetical protein
MVDLTIPAQNHQAGLCGTKAKGEGQRLCVPPAFLVECVRDPFAAFGFTGADTNDWLDGYREFSTAMRKEFPLPGSDIAILAPSLVVDLVAPQAQVDATMKRMEGFLEYVQVHSLPISLISYGVIAGSAKQVANLAKDIAERVATAGVVSDLQTGGGKAQLAVMDSRLAPEVVPAEVRKDADLDARVEAAFLADCKVLLQPLAGVVVAGTITSFPTSAKDGLASCCATAPRAATFLAPHGGFAGAPVGIAVAWQHTYLSRTFGVGQGRRPAVIGRLQ